MKFTSKFLLVFGLFLISCAKDKPTDAPVEVEELTFEQKRQLQIDIVRSILDVNGMQSRKVEDFVTYAGFNIVTLDLSATQVTMLTDSLKDLEELHTLVLDDIFLSKLPDSIVTLENLRTLSLQNSEIDSLPDSLHLLTSLEHIYLNNNNLEELPASIGHLSNLKTLNIEENLIFRLPASIDSFQNLETFIFNRNLIETLPEGIGNLTSLQTLEFNFNLISTLPVSLGQLSSLVTLKFAGNKITSFPIELAQLSSLNTLVIDQNNFSSLPSFAALSNLITLSIADNQLTQLPFGLETMSNLKDLYIQNNSIRTLPLQIGSLIRLNSLIANNNQISQIPYGISGLKNISAINFRNNAIQTFPQSITALTTLKILQFDGNMNLCALSQNQIAFIEKRSNLSLTLCPDSIRSDTLYQSVGNSDFVKGRVFLDSLPFEGAEIFIVNPYRQPLQGQPQIFTDSEGNWHLPLPVGSYEATAFFLEESTLTAWTACFSNFAISGTNNDTLVLSSVAKISDLNKSCNSYIPYPGTEFDVHYVGLADTQLTVDLVNYPLNTLEATKTVSDICKIPDSLVNLSENNSDWSMGQGQSEASGSTTYWEFFYSVSKQETNPKVQCLHSSDSLDNDGDGCIDEELPDGIDNDGDGFVDEDTRFSSYLNNTITIGSLLHLDSLSGDTVTLGPGSRLSYAPDSGFWASGGNNIEDRQKILNLNIPFSDSSAALDSAISTVGGCWRLYPQIFGN